MSNDNAVSESHFKTLKFDPSYPGLFVDADDARVWGRTFFPYYNERPHKVLALVTLASELMAKPGALASKSTPVNIELPEVVT